MRVTSGRRSGGPAGPTGCAGRGGDREGTAEGVAHVDSDVADALTGQVSSETGGDVGVGDVFRNADRRVSFGGSLRCQVASTSAICSRAAGSVTKPSALTGWGVTGIRTQAVSTTAEPV